MAKTKEDYEQMGRDDAECQRIDTGLTPGSWQHRHYYIGFNAAASPTCRAVSATPNLQSIPINSPEAARVKAAFRLGLKLTARQEHIRCLKAELSRKSITAARLLRISHKIMVLQGREDLCEST